MKLDELKVRTVYVDWKGGNICYYDPNEVDAAFAELKAENRKLELAYFRCLQENERLVKCCKEYESRQRIDETIKFNGTKQLRATKRALWMARAERAQEMAWNFHEKNLVEKCAKWDNVHLMCRAKAEEYK